ncbi:MAG: PVC-type heme-binding CxxCH protein [Gemmataceae bacterium]
MKKALILGIPVIVLLTFVSALRAQRDAPKDLDPDPEIERKTFKVADGFEVSLWAADPLLAKPIQINFDAAGRLWVASSQSYPQIMPGQKQNDKILILEDTDGKGRANKTTVFADGLLIPTGVEPGDGGAYVADSTDLLHLSEPDKNGKATKRRVLLSGFGTEDTHHIIHTFRWGPDGMLYFNQSVYIHSHIETPYGVRRLGGGGIWQFRPESRQLETFARGWWNAWGHEFDRWGQSFVTDGAGNEGINYLVPGASYAATPGAARMLQGLNPGSPKYCGQAIISGRHMPDDWQGNIITNDFRAHRVCRFVLKEEGSAYTATEKTELIKSDHPAFRPIDVKMGPDGAIYIADWYNPIIQHGEVDFRDPRRDHTHGRIWRVTAKGRPLVKRPQLVCASPAELLESLKSPETWTRLFAKRVLKERGAEKVGPELARWVSGLDQKDSDYEHHLLEALWTYQALDVVEPKLLKTLLLAHDFHARTAAVRVLHYWHDRVEQPLALLVHAVQDEHPRVRLEAVRGLAHVHNPEAALLALQALDRPMDKFLEYALWLTMRDLQGDWLPAFQAVQLDFGKDFQHVVFALQAIGSPAAVQPLVNLYKAGKIPQENHNAVLALIADLGSPEHLEFIFSLALQEAKVPDQQRSLLERLSQRASTKKTRPAGDLSRLSTLLRSESEPVRRAAVGLAGLWQMEGLRGEVLALAKAKDTSEAMRRAAFDALVHLGGDGSRTALAALARAEEPLAVRRLAVRSLAALDVRQAAQLAAGLLATAPADTDPSEILSAFLEQKQGAQELAAALAESQVPEDVGKVGIRYLRASGRNVDALVNALTKAARLTGKARTLTSEEMKQLIADVTSHGDAAKGEAIYRRADLTCLKCHAIGGAGGQVGPDLSSIGGSAQIDYLIDSLLDPNKAIKENYNTLVVTTNKGKVFTGIKIKETSTELVLRDADSKEVSIPNQDIEEKINGNSLMPNGLTDSLTRAELIDLVRFLSELGRTPNYQLSKARLARRWEVLNNTADIRRQVEEGGLSSAAATAPWQSWSAAYSTVAGELPLSDIPRFELSKQQKSVGFVRCQLEAAKPAKVKLGLGSVEGLAVWLDGVKQEVKPELVLNLAKPGLYTFTISIDLEKRRNALRCRLEDVDGTAPINFVSGR